MQLHACDRVVASHHKQSANMRIARLSSARRASVGGNAASQRWAMSVVSQSAATPAATSSTPKVPDAYIQNADEEIALFQEHQKTAARPTAAEEGRTMMQLAKNAVVSTISTQKDAAGFPFGSLLEYAVDEAGRPILTASTLALHTQDLLADGRCTLTVTDTGFRGLADGRFSLTGTVKELPEADKAAAREVFLKKYPDAFWVDFGDFRWFRMEDIAFSRYVGGFGLVRNVAPKEYLAARPDPVAAFSAPVCGHMNADHESDTIAMVHKYVGIKVASARMLSLDRLGMNLEVARQPGEAPFKLRLPFVRPAEDRKGIKEAIVEMTRAAKAAAAAAAAAAAPQEEKKE